MVELVNTESTLVVEVTLVVNIITELTSINTIPVISVRSVWDTSTRTRTTFSALPSIWIVFGPSSVRNVENNSPRARMEKFPSLTSLKLDTSRCLVRELSPSNPLLLRLNFSLVRLKKKLRKSVVSRNWLLNLFFLCFIYKKYF